MDQVKIGKFIAECRRKINVTQMQLAEKLNITDRAISKWETGKSLPDSSIMLELCDVLGISVNDLLCGEVVTMDNYNKELENNLLEMIKQKEQADKRLLSVEVFIGITATVVLFVLIFVAAFVQMSNGLRITLVVFGFVLFLAGCFYALRMEQVAGYYTCKECGHRYVPTYRVVAMAPHMGRTRYMRCPQCEKSHGRKKCLARIQPIPIYLTERRTTFTSILLRLVTLRQKRPTFVYDKCGPFSTKFTLAGGRNPLLQRASQRRNSYSHLRLCDQLFSFALP